jgi:hypothetical protein
VTGSSSVMMVQVARDAGWHAARYRKCAALAKQQVIDTAGLSAY